MLKYLNSLVVYLLLVFSDIFFINLEQTVLSIGHLSVISHNLKVILGFSVLARILILGHPEK